MKKSILTACLMLSYFVGINGQPFSSDSCQCCQKNSDLIADLAAAVRQLSAKIDAISQSSKNVGHQDLPQDCSDVGRISGSTSGVHKIYIPNDTVQWRLAYCDLNSLGQDWMVFQRRMNGREVFERTWKEYAEGFGRLYEEFWLGNDVLSLLTNKFNYKLRVELEDFEGQKRFAEFSTFKIAPASDNYRITIAGYSGNAGDSMSGTNGFQFSTKDADHDTWEQSCALAFHGAWWYSNCHASNLNGLYLRGNHSSYADGVNWHAFRGHYYSLKFTEMKITHL